MQALMVITHQCIHSSLVDLHSVFSMSTCGNLPVPSLGSSFSSFPRLLELGPAISLCLSLRSGAVATRLKAHGWLQTQLELATEIGSKLRNKPLNFCVSVPNKTAKDKKDAVSKAKQPLGD